MPQRGPIIVDDCENWAPSVLHTLEHISLVWETKGGFAQLEPGTHSPEDKV